MKRDGKSLRNLIGWALLATPLLLLASRPAGRAPTTTNAPMTSSLAAGGKEAGRRAGNNEDNWPEVADFMKSHSRHKWEAFQKLTPAAQAPVRTQLIARFNALNNLVNKRLHEIEVQRVEIEDDLFAAQLSERGRPHAQGYSAPYLDAVRRLVLNRMDERKARLENLTNVVHADEIIRKDPHALNEFVQERAGAIEKNGVGAAAQGARRRGLGQPTTGETEDEAP